MIEYMSRLLFGLRTKFNVDDDSIDRLNSRHTIVILVLFAAIVTTKIYVGDPIHCWVPAQFTGSHREYANRICWVKNTYYVPLVNEVDLPKHDPEKTMISYYQWVPVILAFMCLLFYVPRIVWHYLYRKSGLKVSSVLDAAISSHKTHHLDLHHKTIQYIVGALDKYFVNREIRRDGNCCSNVNRFATICCLGCGKFYGAFLNVSYIFCKLLYIANAIGQLYALDLFMGDGFHWYGVDVVNEIQTEDEWTTSLRFPRVTMCDFQIRHMNRLHRYVVQCVLPINLFNEYIFMFIWFWFALVAALTIVNLMHWIWKSAYVPNHVSYIAEELHNMAGTTSREKEIVRRFTVDYLQRDGVFLLNLITVNVGSFVSAEVITGLWEKYKEERRKDIVRRSPVPDTSSGSGISLRKLKKGLGRSSEDV